MTTKVIYETLWVAKDSTKEYPHGWGFTKPLVEFPKDADMSWIIKTCKELLSNDEFECIGVVPKPLLQNLLDFENIDYPKEQY